MKLQRCHGLTLIELMVTISIVAVLAAIAVPNYQSFIRNSTLKTVANDFSSTLTYARTEAIKRGWPVTVCKSANISATSPSCSTTSTWQAGWLVFVDHDAAGDLDASANGSIPADILLKVGASTNSAIAISGEPNFASYVYFKPDGTGNAANNLSNGTFTICLSESQKIITINNTGRIQTTTGTC